MVRRALAMSMAQRYGSMAISLIVTMVSARMLGPEDFGAFAVASGVTTILTVLAEGGVGNYVVHETRVSRWRLRAAFAVCLMTSALAATIVIGGRHWIAGVFGGERVAALLPILAIPMLLTPFTTIQVGLLRRRMEFGTIMTMGVLGTLALAVVTLGMLWRGMGPEALAWGVVAESVTLLVVVLWRFRRISWHAPALAGWEGIARYAAPHTGAGLVQQAGKLMPQMIIGAMIGLNASGMLNRSTTIANLFWRSIMQGVKPVLLPALAAERRRTGRVDAAWTLSFSHVSVVAWPFLLGLVILAEPAVLILFGEDWRMIVPYVQVLCIGAMTLPVTGTASDCLQATGQTRALFLAESLGYGLHIAVTVMLASSGLTAVVAGLAINGWVIAGIMLVTLRRCIGLPARPVLLATWQSGATTFAALAPVGVIIASGWFDEVEPVVTMLVAAAVSAPAWLAGLALSGHPLWGEILNLFHGVRRRRAHRPATGAS